MRQLVFFIIFLSVFGFVPLAGAVSVCGNDICEGPLLDGNENPCTCPEDCGACAPSAYEVCVEYACGEDDVCRRVSVLACCGDGTCQGLETYGNCPVDCQPQSLWFELVSPVIGDTIARGQEVLLSVNISNAGRGIKGATVTATGFFGVLELFNDGKHGDGNSSDGIYANYFIVPVDSLDANYSTKINASLQGLEGSFDFVLPVISVLHQDISFPLTLFLGETIFVSGNVFRGKEPVQFEFDFNLLNPFGTLLDQKTVLTDQNGFFSYSFRTSLIDPSGEWVMSANGIDSSNNTFSFLETVSVGDPSQHRFLSVNIGLDREKIWKGETVTIIADIMDLGETVNDATVELIDPLNKTTLFYFQGEGKYAVTYDVPFQLPAGDQNFVVRAKRMKGILVEGSEEFTVFVEEKPFTLELILPVEKKFSIGDTIFFRVHAEYAFDYPVLDANAYAVINNQKIELDSTGGGFYSGEYYLKETDSGSLAFEIVLEDKFSNKSSVNGRAEVFGVGLGYYFQQYALLFVLFTGIFSFVFFVVYRMTLQKFSEKKLEKRRLELIELEKSLQTRYFEKASIGKQDYESALESYEEELKETEKKLKKISESRNK